MTLWEVDIHPAAGRPDRLGQAVAAGAAQLGLAPQLAVNSARGFLLEGNLDESQAARLARELFADEAVSGGSLWCCCLVCLCVRARVREG